MLGVSDEVFNISLEIVQLAVHCTDSEARKNKLIMMHACRESNATDFDSVSVIP